VHARNSSNRCLGWNRLAQDCCSIDPTARPLAKQLITRLEEIEATLPRTYHPKPVSDSLYYYISILPTCFIVAEDNMGFLLNHVQTFDKHHLRTTKTADRSTPNLVNPRGNWNDLSLSVADLPSALSLLSQEIRNFERAKLRGGLNRPYSTSAIPYSPASSISSSPQQQGPSIQISSSTSQSPSASPGPSSTWPSSTSTTLNLPSTSLPSSPIRFGSGEFRPPSARLVRSSLPQDNSALLEVLCVKLDALQKENAGLASENASLKEQLRQHRTQIERFLALLK
jgi:hypothetical protein